MAYIYHQATLAPAKLELLAGWLPGRSWFAGGAGLQQVAAYRFDDPAGEVGMEAFLLSNGTGPVWHVPLTYRGAPLEGAEQHLVGTTEHSTLGTRWVYDGCGDPVWVTAVAAVIRTGGTQAEELIEVDGQVRPRASSATVVGSGTPGTGVAEVAAMITQDQGQLTLVRAEELELTVVRVAGIEAHGAHTLTGRWAGGGPVVLACLT